MPYQDFTPTRTLPQLLDDRASTEPEEVALCQWVAGEAVPITWAEYRRVVCEIALGLSERGVGPGDRVAIMSGGRTEFPFAVLAALSVGAVALGVYPTNSPSEVSQILAHSGAVAFIGENAQHLAKVAAVAAGLPDLRVVAGIDEPPEGLPARMEGLRLDDIRAIGARLAAEDPERFQRMLAAVGVDDPAMLVYTSGSTGAPKGVTHSHASLQHSAATVWGYYPEMDRVRHDAVGFLPLAHVAPTIVLIITPLITRLVVTYCRMDEHEEVFRAVKPTAVLWPPRFYEKFAGAVLAHLATWDADRRRAYDEAMVVGREVVQHRWDRTQPPAELAAAYDEAMRSVFIPLRDAVGLGRMTVAWTASAAMPANVMTLWQIWGLDLRETYGLTETGGSVTGHYERSFPRPGDIGAVFPDRHQRWEVRRAEDGEMLLRAPLLFLEYWENPAQTAAVMDDGWFKTGDLIEINPDGRVRLVGRKKDVIITSGGKTISPQPVEVALKEGGLISEAVVVGDGRKYLTVLLELNVAQVGAALGAEAPPERVAERMQAELDRVNAHLARAEQLKDFRILPRPLALETGERTANGKMKREGVVTSFQSLVDEMYASDEAEAIAGHVGG